MNKFHVNDKGEAGQCKAKILGCPFGGAAQHYETPEIAQQAYELSNASRMLPKISKKESKRNKAKANRAIMSRDDYVPAEYDGLDYDQLTFDRPARIKEVKANLLKANSTTPKSQIDAIAASRVDTAFEAWKRSARTEPVKAGDKNAPIRLAPKGTEIVGSDGVSIIGIVENPIVRNTKEGTVAVYTSTSGDVKYVGGNTAINIGKIPSGADRVPPWLWVKADFEARQLEKNRTKFNNS